jgi:hypothetical protein
MSEDYILDNRTSLDKDLIGICVNNHNWEYRPLTNGKNPVVTIGKVFVECNLGFGVRSLAFLNREGNISFGIEITLEERLKIVATADENSGAQLEKEKEKIYNLLRQREE